MTGHTPQKLPFFNAISCIIAVRRIVSLYTLDNNTIPPRICQAQIHKKLFNFRAKQRIFYMCTPVHSLHTTPASSLAYSGPQKEATAGYKIMSKKLNRVRYFKRSTFHPVFYYLYSGVSVPSLYDPASTYADFATRLSFPAIAIIISTPAARFSTMSTIPSNVKLIFANHIGILNFRRVP